MNSSIKNKIYQLFILGLSGSDLNKNQNFRYALKNNLGGVIFFTDNIISEKNFKSLVKDIKSSSEVPLFLSIDQEGGRVERTENIHEGKKYLSAKFIAEQGENAVIKQTREIAKELKNYGLNMNYAPVFDVNTNDANPIIDERAYSNNTEEVIKYATLVAKTYMQNGIIPVAKHFPGHGATDKDSHLTMPVVNLDFETLEDVHIRPFLEAVKNNIPAIMVAHVHYPCFEEKKIPASMSKKIINDYLIVKHNYKGLVLSDDMVMGGISEFERIEALVAGLEAGIDMFIYRNADDEIMDTIELLAKEVSSSKFLQQKVDYTFDKIYTTKKLYL